LISFAHSDFLAKAPADGYTLLFAWRFPRALSTSRVVLGNS
jgi:hypothetical protein